MEIRIKNRIIGDNNPVFIIGEMAWSHDGSIENAKKIIKAVSEAKGDAISIHITCMKEYMTKQYRGKTGITISDGKRQLSIYDYLEKINLKNEELADLFLFSKKLGLITCSQCNDLSSLKFSNEINPDIQVIAASCFIENNLVEQIAKTQKPIILRIGGATLGEIENTISLIKENGNNKIILLHGIQMYPTNIEDTNISFIPTLKNLFSYPAGMADHTDAETDIAGIIPLLAVTLGANAIEKHITYDRGKKGEDHESALNPREFKNLVSNVRLTEKALGQSSIVFSSPKERGYREVVRKKTVAKNDIHKNQTIAPQLTSFKRADEGISPDELRYFLGRKVKYKIKKDEGITPEKLI